MNIFLAPRSNETSYKNFLSTIDNGVDYSIVEPHLDEEGKRILSQSEKLFVWGNKETKKTSWDKMEVDDLVLFYRGKEENERSGKFVYAGKLLYKRHSKDLGLALWPPKPRQEPWTCMFFLKDLRPVYIPISDIAELAGYSTGFVVQGFMPLGEAGIAKILTKFGTIDKFVGHYSRQEAPPESSDLDSSSEITAHSEAQLYLLKIGKMLGYDTYSPDKSKEAFGEKLSDYVSLNELPPRFLGGSILQLAKAIDVIWFQHDVPKCAFEVEHTTKFGAGFQRLQQLSPLSTKLYIVSSSKNYPLFQKFLSADPYYKYKKDFRFRDYKQLENFFKAVSEFSKINDTFLR